MGFKLGFPEEGFNATVGTAVVGTMDGKHDHAFVVSLLGESEGTSVDLTDGS